MHWSSFPSSCWSKVACSEHHKITLAALALLATLPFFVQADRPAPPLSADTAPQVEAPQTEAPRARGDDILEVKPGDVLDDGYRVDAVEGNEVVLVHLASGLRQTVGLSAPAARIPPKALREG